MKKRVISLLLIITLIFSAAMLAACGGTNPDGNNKTINSKFIDVFIFMGQSNMAGRGEAAESIPCGEGHGFEFRAVSDPSKLYPVAEPFGAYENNANLSDITGGDPKKTGGLTSAFCEAYYESAGVPILAISCSIGHSTSAQWANDTEYAYLAEAKSRLQNALYYMDSQDEYTVRHINMVWLLGETEASSYSTAVAEAYKTNLQKIISEMKDIGVQKCFLLTIGSYISNTSTQTKYKNMAQTQIDFCQSSGDAVLVSKKLMKTPEPLMHLNNHFHQGGYNVAGYDAGTNAANYLKTNEAPVCTDYVSGEEKTLAEKYGINLTYKT